MSKILSFLCIVTIALPINTFAADPTFTEVRDRITDVKNVNPLLPTTVSEPKGKIGTIISGLFTAGGKIKNEFLEILDGLSLGDANNIPKWNGTGFVPSSMYEVSGDVGIGVPLPSFELDISGDINYTGDLYNNGSILETGKFIDGSLPAYAVYDGGNVGIGLNTPLSRLHVNGGPSMTGGYNRVATFQGTHPTIQLKGGSDTNGSSYIGYDAASSSEALHFWVGQLGNDNGGTSTAKMTIESGGNIGIGNTNPAYKLDITGDINFTGDMYDGGVLFNSGKFVDGTISNSAVYTVGSVGIGTTTVSSDLSLDVQGKVGATQYCDESGGNCFVPSSVVLSGSTVEGSGVTGYVTKFLSPTELGSSVVFDDGTNIGIGTGTPSRKLDVSGDINFSGNLYKNGSLFSSGKFIDGTSSSDAVYTAGDVGIGVSNPAAAFHVGSGEVRFPGAGGGLTHFNYAGTTNYIRGTTIIADTGGNVGIGAGAPQSKLHVKGAVEVGRQGLYGTYSSYQTQGIWSIGRGYPIDGSATNNFGTQYGMVYAHTNAGTAAIGGKKPLAGQGHQILFTGAGTTKAMISLTYGNATFAGKVTTPNVSTNCVGNCPASATPPASGNWSVTGNLNVTGNLSVTGNITANNFHTQAPTFGYSNKGNSSSYVSNAAAWSATNRITRINIVVPAGPSRRYRLSGKAMKLGVNKYGVIRIVKSTGAGVLGAGASYEYGGGHGDWEMVYIEGFVTLAPGTHTYYIETYGGGSYASQWHTHPSYSQLIAWPLQ